MVAQALSMWMEPDWQLKEACNSRLVLQPETVCCEVMKKNGRRWTKRIKRKETTLKYDVLVRSLHL
jgi:hypothetical protein